MAYITSRLSGLAYAQVALRIRFGQHQFQDFHEILHLMEAAFGDPDRVRNAQNELFRLRQRNSDFSTFYAEFERLALEGEMPEASRGLLLMQNISHELHKMLLHTPTLSKEYRQLVRHLQELDNRRLQYVQRQRPTKPRHPIDIQQVRNSFVTTPQPATDLRPGRVMTPMDLSTTRSRTDKERGACYLCHRTGHLARDCSLPNPRYQQGQRRGSNDSQKYLSSID
jgi:hypothetical protein